MTRDMILESSSFCYAQHDFQLFLFLVVEIYLRKEQDNIILNVRPVLKRFHDCGIETCTIKFKNNERKNKGNLNVKKQYWGLDNNILKFFAFGAFKNIFGKPQKEYFAKKLFERFRFRQFYKA
jgi:hypothetical protein